MQAHPPPSPIPGARHPRVAEVALGKRRHLVPPRPLEQLRRRLDARLALLRGAGGALLVAGGALLARVGGALLVACGAFLARAGAGAGAGALAARGRVGTRGLAAAAGAAGCRHHAPEDAVGLAQHKEQHAVERGTAAQPQASIELGLGVAVVARHAAGGAGKGPKSDE
jgi:hypothetical protein